MTILWVLLPTLAASWSPAAAEGHGARWTWPLAPGHELVRAFDVSAGPYGAGHRGIDVRGGDATVHAVEAGVVRFTGVVAGRPVISILHAGGLLSTYEPVVASVAPGDAVAAGSVIGTLDSAGASSHCAPELCLHLGARVGERYVDPLLLLGARGPSVLLPVAGSAGSDSRGDAGTGSARPISRSPSASRVPRGARLA